MTVSIAQDNQKNSGILSKLAMIIGQVPAGTQGVLNVVLTVVGIGISIWLLSKIPFVQQGSEQVDFIMAVAMLFGILAKEVWDNINDTGTVGLRFVRLAAAIIVAPIVYSSVKDKFDVRTGVSLNSFAIAFQQGFFWQAVFRTISYGTQRAVERQHDNRGTNMDRQSATVQTQVQQPPQKTPPPTPDAAQLSGQPAAHPAQH
jgi:hypothetical protein